MNKDREVLFLSLIKWSILASFIGIIVGTFTTYFIKVVHLGVDYVGKINNYYLFLPIALFLSSFIIIKLAPAAKGHGTEKAIEAIHKKKGNIDIKVVPVKLLTTFITVIFGGSVGLEGPSTQIGAGIASFFGQKLKLKEIDKKKLVVCGISAGFVSVLGAPIGAAIFGVEVLYIGKISYVALLPSIFASISSYYTGLYLGRKQPSYFINYVPANKIGTFLNIFFFGVFIGIMAIVFIKLVNYAEEFFDKLKMYPPLKGIIGGALIITLVYLFSLTDYIGIGDGIIDKALSGQVLNKGSFFIKTYTTSLTLGSGGSGGILTPMLFLGSSLGNLWSSILKLNIPFYSAVGMISFLGASSNTPIAAIIIAVELFGHTVGIYTAIACGIGYLILGHQSIYPTQILMFSKSPSIFIDENCEIKKVKH